MWTAKTATGWGAAVRPSRSNASFTGRLVGTSGAVAATIEIYGTNDAQVASDPDNAAKVLLGTITLSGTGAGASSLVDSGGFVAVAPWTYYIAKLTAISGTGASTDVLMGAGNG